MNYEEFIPVERDALNKSTYKLEKIRFDEDPVEMGKLISKTINNFYLEYDSKCDKKLTHFRFEESNGELYLVIHMSLVEPVDEWKHIPCSLDNIYINHNEKEQFKQYYKCEHCKSFLSGYDGGLYKPCPECGKQGMKRITAKWDRTHKKYILADN